jgi:hypothetical protein
MVVVYILQTPTSAELDDEDVGRRVILLFKVFNILDNVGLLRDQFSTQKNR